MAEFERDVPGAHPDARAALCRLVASAEHGRAETVMAFAICRDDDGAERWIIHSGGDDKHKAWTEGLMRLIATLVEERNKGPLPEDESDG